MKQEYIEVLGARVHNLKNIDIRIPREKLVVITGLSGSGKSSLAFDTIYAEGQRRYIETFSAYARQFLGGLERPDVDKIEGLSPVIAIEQKTTSKSPRSTVGTITEVYDFLRLLYARVGIAYSYNTNEKMVSYTDDQIQELILKDFNDQKTMILAPVIKSRKGHYRELFQQISKQGFVRVRVDGVVMEIERGMKLDRYKTHDIEIVIDRLVVNQASAKRLMESIVTAMYHGDETLMVIKVSDEIDAEKPRYFSRNLMCPTTGISYPKPEPNSFSFNSPKGACEECNGLGKVHKINMDLIIPDKKISIRNGGLAPLGEEKKSWIFKQLGHIADKFGFSMSDPIQSIPAEAMEIILNGGKDKLEINSKELGVSRKYEIDFEGSAGVRGQGGGLLGARGGRGMRPRPDHPPGRGSGGGGGHRGFACGANPGAGAPHLPRGRASVLRGPPAHRGPPRPARRAAGLLSRPGRLREIDMHEDGSPDRSDSASRDAVPGGAFVPTPRIDSPRDLPRALRPREKLFARGPDVLSHGELVALILGVGTRAESVTRMANRLVRRHGLGGLARMTADAWRSQSGLGAVTAARMCAVFELGRRTYGRDDGARPRVTGPRQAFELLRQLGHARKEHLVGLYLDAQNGLLCRETISIGSLNTTRTHPREILFPAVTHLALGFILAHNHPSGSLDPSPEDVEFTQSIRRAGELMGIELYDHLLVTRGGYTSFKERGLL